MSEGRHGRRWGLTETQRLECELCRAFKPSMFNEDLGTNWRDLGRRVTNHLTLFSSFTSQRTRESPRIERLLNILLLVGCEGGNPFPHCFPQFSPAVTIKYRWPHTWTYAHCREIGSRKIQLMRSWVFEAILISSLVTSPKRTGSPCGRNHG